MKSNFKVEFPAKQLRRFINDNKAKNKTKIPDIIGEKKDFVFPDDWYHNGPVRLDQPLAKASQNKLLLFYAPDGLFQLENSSRIGIDCTFRVPKEYLQVMVICTRKDGKDSACIACFMTNKSSQMYDQGGVQKNKNMDSCDFERIIVQLCKKVS